MGEELVTLEQRSGGRYLRGRGENDERKKKIKAGLQFQKMTYALLNRKPHFVKAKAMFSNNKVFFNIIK
jgi:hypothetical protein